MAARTGREELRHGGEVAAVGVVRLDREIVGADLLQRVGQAVDGVVAHRARGVAAGIGDLEPVVLREFLARLDVEDDRLAVFVQLAAGAFVEGEFGVDQVALVGGSTGRH